MFVALLGLKVSNLRFESYQRLIKKRNPVEFLFFINLGRKDSNLRDGWTKTSCLTTWRRPITSIHIIILFQWKLSSGGIYLNSFIYNYINPLFSIYSITDSGVIFCIHGVYFSPFFRCLHFFCQQYLQSVSALI